MIQPEIFNRIQAERQRQDDKWGQQSHDDYVWLAILSEEVGEAAQAILKVNDPAEGSNVFQDSDVEWELVQAAAVIVAWLESRQRR